MTIEELLGHSAEELKNMTDEMLLERLGPYLVTSQPPGLEKLKALMEEEKKPKPRKPRKKKADNDNKESSVDGAGGQDTGGGHTKVETTEGREATVGDVCAESPGEGSEG